MFGTPEIVAVDWGFVLPWVVVITRLVTFWGVTVTLAVAVTPCALAVMVAVPVATPVTSPPALIVAMVLSELDQPTEEPVSVFELPSEYRAVAISCWVLVTATEAEGGVMKIELMEGLIKKPEQPAQLTQRKSATPTVTAKRM